MMNARFAPSTVTDIVRSRGLRIVFVLLAMWFVLGVHPETRDAFLTSGNFSNLTAQVAEIVVIGVGMTLVVLVGGIDLSVGAGMALAGVVAARLQIELHQPAWIAVLASIAVSALVGAWHGLLVTRLSIPPFIATLSGFLAYRGAAVVLSGARGLAPMGEDFQKLGGRLPSSVSIALAISAGAIGVALVLRRNARRKTLRLEPLPGSAITLRIAAIVLASALGATIYREGMPVPVVIAGGATALGAIVLRKTRLGRYAFAIGGSQEAARLSGVPVAKVKMAIYVATGVLTALAGIIATARTNGVTPATTGLTRELHVVTAVVIGGTSLSGGRGTMFGTLVGALVIGTLQNGMNLMGVNSNWQSIVTGQILLAAALLDVLSSKTDLPTRTRRVAMTALAAGALAALVAVVAQRTSAAGGNRMTGKEEPAVAFLLSTLQEERYQKDQKYFEKKIAALGLHGFTLAADNDNGKQLAALEDALSRGAKVIVIQPTDSVAAASYVEKAHARGAKVVAYDRSIKSDALDYYVAHDSFEVGKLIADAAVLATGGKGNFVLLDGQAGHSVASEIGRGIHSVVDPLVATGKVKIVVEQTHDAWSPEQSLKTVEDAIATSRGDIQAILAHNSGMARGAVQGVAAAGLADKGIFIGGADADAANINYVCEGKQTVEVLKDIAPLAEKAAEIAAALAAGKVLDVTRTPGSSAPTINVPVRLVTKENAKKLLVDSGFHAANAVPACK